MGKRGPKTPQSQLFTELSLFTRDRNAAGAVEAFDRAVRDIGGAFETRIYHKLLALLLDLPADWARVRQQMLESGAERDETTVTLELRGLVHAGELDEAISCAVAAQQQLKLELKLRTFAPLLAAVCARDDTAAARQLQETMGAAGVAKGEDEMVQLAALCARTGDHDGFESHLYELQASHQMIATTSLQLLRAACASAETASGNGGDGEHARAEASASAASNAPAVSAAAAASADHARPHAAVGTCPGGVCSCCGTQLVALPLSTEQRREMCDDLLRTAAAHSEESRADLLRFGEWVVQQGFTHIVDGPNVAYRSQNFAGGSFSYVQVDLACRTLRESTGRPPLLVLPSHYVGEEAGATVPNHTSSSANTTREHVLTAAEAARVATWRRGDGDARLWVCVEGASDDWYWMYATVVAGAEARVLSNDEMRDHSLRLLKPAYFARWKARHVIHFDFSHGAQSDRPEPVISLREPPAFSVEIQRSEGARDDDDARARWHLPVGPDAAEWLCVALNRSDGGGSADTPAAKRQRGYNSG